jgi:hypothetical protein
MVEGASLFHPTGDVRATLADALEASTLSSIVRLLFEVAMIVIALILMLAGIILFYCVVDSVLYYKDSLAGCSKESARYSELLVDYRTRLFILAGMLLFPVLGAFYSGGISAVLKMLAFLAGLLFFAVAVSSGENPQRFQKKDENEA